MEAFISRFRYQASKAKLVQSRIKQLEKVERLEPPAGAQKPPAIHFPKCERSARRVFELKRRGQTLRRADGLRRRRSDDRTRRANRAGRPQRRGQIDHDEDAGGRRADDRAASVSSAPNVEIGYFAQNLAESLDYDKTVLDELSDAARKAMTTGEIRSLLGAMLFSGDDVAKARRRAVGR